MREGESKTERDIRRERHRVRETHTQRERHRVRDVEGGSMKLEGWSS